MKHLFSFVLILIGVAGIAQTRTARVPQARAFFTVAVPGTLHTDENGNAEHNFIVSRFIIIETTGKQPLTVLSITSQGKSYSLSVETVTDNFIVVGTSFTKNNQVKLKASKANRLWKIAFSPMKGKANENALKNIKVVGQAGGKSFKLVLPRDEQLAAPLYY
ncbi:MAG: hypothetical protein ABIY51_11850 [Ferruginibacter sp.]